MTYSHSDKIYPSDSKRRKAIKIMWQNWRAKRPRPFKYICADCWCIFTNSKTWDAECYSCRGGNLHLFYPSRGMIMLLPDMPDKIRKRCMKEYNETK